MENDFKGFKEYLLEKVKHADYLKIIEDAKDIDDLFRFIKYDIYFMYLDNPDIHEDEKSIIDKNILLKYVSLQKLNEWGIYIEQDHIYQCSLPYTVAILNEHIYEGMEFLDEVINKPFSFIHSRPIDSKSDRALKGFYIMYDCKNSYHSGAFDSHHIGKCISYHIDHNYSFHIGDCISFHFEKSSSINGGNCIAHFYNKSEGIISDNTTAYLYDKSIVSYGKNCQVHYNYYSKWFKFKIKTYNKIFNKLFSKENKHRKNTTTKNILEYGLFKVLLVKLKLKKYL